MDMHLPHQGFEILDKAHFQLGGFWIDAYMNKNLSIVYPRRGSDEKIIIKMLEDALDTGKMLGKMIIIIFFHTRFSLTCRLVEGKGLLVSN